MNEKSILKELESLGGEGTKRILMRHGAKEPLFGVKVGDLKKLQKRIGVDHGLALALYETGNYDAMYLACLIADDEKMTKTQLRKWAREAYGGSLSGSTVPWVATGSSRGWDLALEWIDSPKDYLSAIGWSTLSSIAMVWPDDEMHLPTIKKLLGRVKREIRKAPNDTCHAMNGFVIAVGSGIASLFDEAFAVAEAIGEVRVDHGETSCQTPFAPDYLHKVKAMNRVGKKKKTAKC
ncbi:MAG: DNA alkylation repair protein [Verrucomicrobiota bacterium]